MHEFRKMLYLCKFLSFAIFGYFFSFLFSFKLLFSSKQSDLIVLDADKHSQGADGKTSTGWDEVHHSSNYDHSRPINNRWFSLPFRECVPPRYSMELSPNVMQPPMHHLSL